MFGIGSSILLKAISSFSSHDYNSCSVFSVFCEFVNDLISALRLRDSRKACGKKLAGLLLGSKSYDWANFAIFCSLLYLLDSSYEFSLIASSFSLLATFKLLLCPLSLSFVSSTSSFARPLASTLPYFCSSTISYISSTVEDLPSTDEKLLASPN